MIVGGVLERVQKWIVQLVVKSIESMSTEEDRLEIVRWLTIAREILSSDGPNSKKFANLYRVIDTKKTFNIVFNGVVETIKNYKDADLPLPVKMAIPLTLLATPFIGGQGAGVAAVGGAVGLPALLLIFIGTAGITSIIEAFFGNGKARNYISVVLAMIVRDEVLRRTSKAMKEAMQAEPSEPIKFDMPVEELELRAKLLAMDPFDFEHHIMRFFMDAGMMAWVTKKSNDFGVDGFARHVDGLLVVQCKRNTTGNKIGRPTVQQLKGVVEENGALRGYLVSTADFTDEATESAKKFDKIVLIGMENLLDWHRRKPDF